MTEISRRELVKLAVAAAGGLLGDTPAWAQVLARVSNRKSPGREGDIPAQIPQELLRLAGLEHIPALPINIPETLETIPRLLKRLIEEMPAKQGLSNTYTLAGQTKTGFEFLFGEGRDGALPVALAELQQALRRHPVEVINELHRDLLNRNAPAEITSNDSGLTALALESPDQWTISWTNFQEIYAKSLPLLERWAATMTDVAIAEEEFWPTIARYGVAYNLLMIQKLTLENHSLIREKLGDAWTDDHTSLLDAGRLYSIDMSIFESLRPSTVDGFTRFTPATITLLEQEPGTKSLKPILILVSGESGSGAQTYSPATATPSAWLYAMLAAKTSITVYGIWLGHVYQWHVVTAAMLMTMHNELPRLHPVRELLAPQSDFLVGFDDVLLLLWRQITPPTSVSTPFQFLKLINEFGNGRPFAADNPRQAIADLGLDAADFTVDQNTPWDQFPIVGYFLEIWDASEAYVRAVVDASYSTDRAVRRDRHLQNWFVAAQDEFTGNIRSLPELNGKDALSEVLTSLIYRITVHGISRLTNTANPAMTFVPNFPPCLQNADIPDPGADFDTTTMLAYLPRTGTIGLMTTFYFTFAFTAPYVPLIPENGVEAELFFPGGTDEPRNRALIQLRQELQAFISRYQTENPQFQQWPRNIET